MKVFAHRGSSTIWPENTLLAFGLAHEAGARGFETDLRLSSDNEIVLGHDPALDRVGHPGVEVARTTAARLCDMEVASPDGSMRDRVTTLRRLLSTYPHADYIFDCKVDDEALFLALARLLTETGADGSVWFLTWSRRADGHVKRTFPGMLRFPSYRRSALWGALSVLGVGRLAEPRRALLSLPTHHAGLPVFGPRQVASVTGRGKTFMGYLVNTARQYERCVACGVTTVLTDRPDVICLLARLTGPETHGGDQRMADG